MQTEAYFRERAAHFRNMASECDAATAASLIQLAEEYEAGAERLRPGAGSALPAA